MGPTPMSNIINLPDCYAYPIERVDIVLGPLDPEWQPTPAHIAIVAGVHAAVSLVASLAVIGVVLVGCLVMGG